MLHLPLSVRQAEPQSPRSDQSLLSAQPPPSEVAWKSGLTDPWLSHTDSSVLHTLPSALHTVCVLQRFLLSCCPVPRVQRKAAPLQYSIPFLFRKAALLQYSAPSASESVRFLPPKAASFFPLTLFCRMPVLFLSLQAVLFRRKVLSLLPQVWFFHLQVHQLSDSAPLFRFPALPPLLPASLFRSQVPPLCLSALPCRMPVPALYRRWLLSH